MGEVRVVAERIFNIKPFDKLVVGDPMYFERANVEKRFKKLVVDERGLKCVDSIATLQVRDMLDNDGYTWWSLAVTQVSKKSRQLGEMFISERAYIEEMLAKDIILGCDSAKFVIEVDGREYTIHNGADGRYGSFMRYKGDSAVMLEFDLDKDFFDVRKINEFIHYLFK